MTGGRRTWSAVGSHARAGRCPQQDVGCCVLEIGRRLAGEGLIGIMLAFGAQWLIRDVLTGPFILHATAPLGERARATGNGSRAGTRSDP